jgi:type IX secretion system PorP/SprF family membrane protein
MKKSKKSVILAAMLVMAVATKAQDPSFSQFFSSPLNINPALTANINADWRAIANFRNQWLGPASPYVTGTVSYDRKIFQRKGPNEHVPEGNVLGLGGMLMFDRAMAGVAKSTYASLNLSYNVKLTEGDIKHKIAAGFGAIYGERRIDFSRVDFEEQFTGYGFNTNLPTGESSLSNMKPYFSLSAGITYSITTEQGNFDIGVSGFHLNKPKQSFLEDENQVLAMRKVVHSNFERFLNDRVILNVNGIYQYQSAASYFSIGGGLGYYLPSSQDVLVMAGLWYWSENAVIPYFSFAYNDFQIGLSYDLTTSKLNQAADKPNTWELSVILRGRSHPPTVIPCPWK